MTALTRSPGRPREFDADAAVGDAMALFQERGFHSTSMSDLSAATGLTAGSLYKAFRDKETLFLLAFQRYADQRAAQLRALSERAASGREALAAVLALYADLSSGAEGRKGCLVATSAAELSTLSPAVAEAVALSLGRSERFLTEVIARGRDDGSLPRAADPAAAARFVLCTLQGMRVLGKAGASRAAMQETITFALAALAGGGG